MVAGVPYPSIPLGVPPALAMHPRPTTPSPSHSTSTDSTASTTSPQTPIGQVSFHSPGVIDRADGMDEAGQRLIKTRGSASTADGQPTPALVRPPPSSAANLRTNPPLPPTPPTSSSSHPPTFTFAATSPPPSSPPSMAAAVATLPPSASPTSVAFSSVRRRPPPPLALNSPKKREHSLDDVVPRPKTPLTGSSISSDASEVTDEKLERLGLAVRGNLRMRPLGQGAVLSDDITDSPISPADSARTFHHYAGPSFLRERVSPSPPVPASVNALSPAEFAHKLTTSSSPPLIVDLRTLDAYLDERVPTSINVALPSLILKRAVAGSWAGASWSSWSSFITTLDGQDRWRDTVGPTGPKQSGQEIVVIPGDRSGSGEGVRATFEKLTKAAGRDELVWVLDGGIDGLTAIDARAVMQGEQSGPEEDALLHELAGAASSPPSASGGHPPVQHTNPASATASSSSSSSQLASAHPANAAPPAQTRNFPTRSLTLPSSSHAAAGIKPLLSPSAIAQFSQLSPSFSSASSSKSSTSTSPQSSDGRRSKPPSLQLNTLPSSSGAPSHTHPFPSTSAPRSLPGLATSVPTSSAASSFPSTSDTGKTRPPKLSLRTLGTQPAAGPRALSLDVASSNTGLQKKASRGLLIQTDLGDRRTSGGQVNGGGRRSGGAPSSGSRTPNQSLFPGSLSQPQTMQGLCRSQADLPPSPSSFSGTMGDMTRLQPTNGSSSSAPYEYDQSNTTPSTSSTFHASPLSSADSSPNSSGPEQFVVSTILPGFLYLGPDPTTEDEVAQLNAVGVKRILNMAVECEDELGLASRFEVYKKVGMRDSVEEMGVAKGLKEACAFLDDARLHSSPTYVHCRAGKSRSVTVVLAYLIHSHRWSLKKAYAYVLERRKGISPNIGFMAELLNVEAELGRAASPAEGGHATAGDQTRAGAGRVRESLPPAWTLSAGGGNGGAGLGADDEDSGLVGMGMGVAGEAKGDEMEVRRNGQYHHKQRPPVDTTTLQPQRRVSKAGLEGVSGGLSLNWEAGRPASANDVEMKSPSPRSPRTPTPMNGVVSKPGWV